MCSFSLVIAVLFIIHTNAESSEDPQAFTYYAPSTLNFHDIYANSLAMLTGETVSPNSILKDDVFSLPSQFDLQSPTLTGLSSTTIASKNVETSSINGTEYKSNTTMSGSSTEETEELTVKGLTISKGKTGYQRGVLDLLFPATRVKNFKNVFDTVRRLLSHTF